MLGSDLKMKKIIIIFIINASIIGCSPIISTLSLDENAYTEMVIGLRYCDEARYEKYLELKEKAMGRDPGIINYKGFFLFKHDLSKRICECEKSLNKFLAKKETEKEEKFRLQREKNIKIAEENRKKEQKLTQQALNLGFSGIRWSGGISGFLENVKTGKETLSDSINWVFHYRKHDKYFKVFQILDDVVLYMYDGYWQGFSWIHPADGSIILLPKGKNELYIEGQPLTKKDGSYFAFIGVQKYKNVLGVIQQALVFEQVF